MLNKYLGFPVLLLMIAGCTTPSPTSQVTPSLVPAINTLPASPATPTPISTTPPEEILNLFRTNGGCLLPCWWGIVPGETSIGVVKDFTKHFGDFGIHVLRQDTGNFAIRVPDGAARPVIDVVYGPLQDHTVEWLRVSPGLDYKGSDGDYEIGNGWVQPELFEYYPAYTMAAVLTTYGRPDVVLLNGDMVNEPGPPVFVNRKGVLRRFR